VRNPFRPDPAHPFQLAKFLSWSSLILILCSSLFLTVIIGNYAKQVLMKKNKEFALLLAENLNHQIYQRFTLPTVLGFGRVQLKEPAQYKRLEQIINITIHSFHVLRVRIYDVEGTVSYATDKELVGQRDLAGNYVKKAVEERSPSFEVISNISPLRAAVDYKLEPESFVLRTTYPLRAERSLGRWQEKGTIMGVLEFTQDITSDYETIIYFQWIIGLIAFVASLILFFLLYIIIQRADRLVAERIQEKERLERQLHQNEKLASMGRMVASIAHEIRNPLGIIRSSAEILSKKAQAEDNASSRLLKAIFDESKRLSQTVNDFLDYARPKQPKLETFDLLEIVDRVLTFLEPEINKHKVHIDRRLPDKLPVQGDKDLIYRALYNLLSNSLQAMQNGQSPGSIMLTGSIEEDQVMMSIRDSGPGFDPSMMDKYLEPFYTTKETGTGLGLSIVNNILENQNAHLHLENAPEGGALATISFPRPEA
jgi:signal transduction histidine kinase